MGNAPNDGGGLGGPTDRGPRWEGAGQEQFFETLTTVENRAFLSRSRENRTWLEFKGKATELRRTLSLARRIDDKTFRRWNAELQAVPGSTGGSEMNQDTVERLASFLDKLISEAKSSPHYY